MEVDKSGWKWVKVDKIGRTWMKVDEHEWTWMKVDESGWKWMWLMLWPLAVTPWVTHFGASHGPPDGYFCCLVLFIYSYSVLFKWSKYSYSYSAKSGTLNNIRIRIRPNFWIPMVFVYVFDPKNIICSPLFCLRRTIWNIHKTVSNDSPHTHKLGVT